MIVRDEEDNLPRCLESARGLFDEIVVVNTGSIDRTREIAASSGARVVNFDWVNDFSAARNEALAHATGDYTFWLDADDVIDPPARAAIRDLLDGLQADDEAGYVVRCASGRYIEGTEIPIDHVRLFPIRDDIRWSHRLHEQIWPALERSQVPLRRTGITLRHTGYADPGLVARKTERNLRILNKAMAERPEDPHVLYYLGSLAFEREEWSVALGYFERALAATTSELSRGDCLGWIALAHFKMEDYPAALRTCDEAISVFPDEAGYWYFKAEVHRRRNEQELAEASWRRILTLGPPRWSWGIDPGTIKNLARRKLALLVAYRGDLDGAAKLWREVMAEAPADDVVR